MKRWRKRSDSSTQSGPNQNAAKKDKIDPRWKVRIQAIVLIGLMVIPGNLGTLIIYFTSEGSPIENSGNSTSNATEIDNYEYEDEQNLFNETLGTEGNDTIPVDSGNGSTYLTKAGYYCHEKFDVILPIIDSIRFWIEGVSLTVIAIFGLMGNLLTIVVFRNYDRTSNSGSNYPPPQSGGRSPFNTILTTLVTFDSFFLGFSLFDSAYSTLFHLPEPIWYKAIFPYFWHPLKNVVTSGCVFMVVAVATERYFAICRPLFVKPRPSFFISLVVLASILINVPKFFEFKYMYKNETLDYWTSDLNEDATYVVFSSYYECAVIGIIPLLALCYLNYKIYTGIKSSTKNSITKHVGGSESSTSVYKLSDTRRCSEIPHHLSGLRANRPTRSQSRDFPGEQYELEAMNPPLRNGDTFKDSSGTIETPLHPTSRSNRLLSVAHCPPAFSAISVRSEITSRRLSMEPNGVPRSISAPRVNEVNRNSGNKERKHFQNRKEKSTGILVGIILVFFLCHVFRLSIQIYEIFSPTHGLQDHYLECYALERLHVPAVVHIAGSVNHLLLVANSSVNFLIYCLMAKRFRQSLVALFESWKCCCSREPVQNVPLPQLLTPSLENRRKNPRFS